MTPSHAKLKVWVYTVNEIDDFIQLADVDGVFTDVPELLLPLNKSVFSENT